MATLGQKPATQHVSTEKQTLTGNGGTSYTLQQSVSQAADIEVFVNNTRQEPTVAYTASGTTLTMTGAVNASDSFYVIFQGKAIQTAGLPVDAAITASTITTSQTITSTGNITTSGTVNTPSINGGQIGGRRNLIINGAMQVAQRGTSSTGSGFGTVDRFSITRGTVTATQSQESLASGDTPYSLGFRKYLRITNTGTTSATNSYIGTRHRIEGQNIAMSGWNYTSTSSDITISFWVRSSLAGTYYMNLRSDDGTAQNYTIPVVLSANTWTKIIKTVSGDSGITINNDNGVGLDVLMWVHLGTDYTTSSHTSNQWNTYSGTDQAPDYSQNWNNTSSATFDLTGVQLEVGSQATPFEHRSYGEELALCQRYHFRITGNENNNASDGGFGMATNWDTNTFFTTLDFPVQMRAAPSFSFGAALSDFLILSTTATAEPTGISLNGASKQRCEMNFQKSGGFGTAGYSGWLRIVDNTNGFIAFDSEL